MDHMMGESNSLCSATLTIDLDAIAANYAIICNYVGDNKTAAVVKANAYGLGAEKVISALDRSGCKIFFVATIEEAIDARSHSPLSEIHVLNGILPGWEEPLVRYNLCPVINNEYQAELWINTAKKLGGYLPADIHVDTGMNRLGISAAALEKLHQNQDFSQVIDTKLVMSHLANAENKINEMNSSQLVSFQNKIIPFKNKKYSLAASSGIFLGPEYHFDLVRPGIALYGGNPTISNTNPMFQVVRLQSKVLQLQYVDSHQTIGYGSTHKVTDLSRIATISIGYADGYFRSLSNLGRVWIGEYEAEVVGRISMDLTTVDVSNVPESMIRIGDLVDFICPRVTIDSIARNAGTISYELLTGLSSRLHRNYIGNV